METIIAFDGHKCYTFASAETQKGGKIWQGRLAYQRGTWCAFCGSNLWYKIELTKNTLSEMTAATFRMAGRLGSRSPIGIEDKLRRDDKFDWGRVSAGA